MKWYPKNPKCCEADVTVVSTVMTRVTRRPPTFIPRPVNATIVRHYRERDQAHFWHWSDQEVVRI